MSYLLYASKYFFKNSTQGKNSGKLSEYTLYITAFNSMSNNSR